MFPLRRFTVTGDSMLPTYRPGEIVLINTWARPRIDDVVIARDPRDAMRRILKRVTGIRDTEITLAGDNPNASTDSRTFGSITRNDILGRVVYPKKPFPTS